MASPESEFGAPDEAAVLQSMTLLATLSTAADLREVVTERRTGPDPTAQEERVVAVPHLYAAAQEVSSLTMQLLLSHVSITHRHEPDIAAVVRHFDQRMKLQRIARLTRSMHQRLLSLYPDVSEALTEEARQVERDGRALVDSDVETFADDLAPFLQRTLSLAAWVRHEIPW